MQADDCVVVSRNPISTIGSAAKATMHNHLLAIGAVGHADRLHHRAALAGAVAGPASIDVFRPEAERTVVAMLAAPDRWANEGAAMTAFKRFGSAGAARWPLRAAVWIERGACPGIFSGRISVFKIEIFGVIDICDPWQRSGLPATAERA